jgi:hypothetical protein
MTTPVLHEVEREFPKRRRGTSDFALSSLLPVQRTYKDCKGQGCEHQERRVL